MQKNKMPEKIGQEPTKENYQEECKQIDTVTAIKEDIKEEEVWKKKKKNYAVSYCFCFNSHLYLNWIISLQKETPENCLNSMKNTDDATEKTQPEIQEIEKLSSVSETQDKPPKV